ncbi:probable N-acetylglucosaminyl-phosphatidylinositol de-N-acetylase isoform X1 [Coffea eugenioides]|uniref:probable N-acetylglucosaminyl-phosphatidylinositol de-N-acetylase isoform X1 n=1 Tax=Coffea eugenioides TaxID=49369 RepID=UPI000F60ABB1|nr:probable N-acetylglucosaminyl-phosphatidylinositol de-N-acetylase isoform X1 [Coffea eugenioides]XP_027165788.1 probable N-acetylglucosaminyl-phosphatidylinositol de-N-acetylase isoform X1 [Coffea eugenioides]
MVWLVIVGLLVLLWAVSLGKIHLGSSLNSKTTFLNDNASAGLPSRKNVLLVIAHPDDETMFFSPTINYLTSRGHNVYILCLSTGNADGIGGIRKEELYLASVVLKVPSQRVKVVDHPDLQDGFHKVWNCNLLEIIIKEEVDSKAIDVIITFDNYGVSGHCNHCDVHQGVRKLLQNSSQQVEAWELVSNNILRKYSGPVDIWLSILLARKCLNRELQSLLNENPFQSYAAMAQHRSQWIWFRKLFVSFSSYTYVNTLKMMNR